MRFQCQLFLSLFPLVSLTALISHSNDDVVPGKYIIQLQPGIKPEAIRAHHLAVRGIHERHARRQDSGVDKRYQIGNFSGYAGSFDEVTVKEISYLPEVVAIEPDRKKYPADFLTSSRQIEKRDPVIQENAPWGLQRISHRAQGASDYVYDSSAGGGNYVYVLDTGILPTHVEFEGRTIFGYNAAAGSEEPIPPAMEHGTSVASCAIGKTFGVAKKATAIDVNLFGDGTGSTTDSIILDGFNWAVNHAISKNRANVSVINMSLAGTRISAWDSVFQNALDLGILTVVAAGNENLNASERWPASSPAAFAIGNMNSTNGRQNNSPTFGSNWGPAVDIFAPGTALPVAVDWNDTATTVSTGTSLASPVVAGLVCYLRGLDGAMGAQRVRERVLGLATKDIVIDPKGSPNLLAYNGSGK